MSLTCEEIKNSIQNFSLLRDCRKLRSGITRLETPFQYPDGSFIDLFLQEKPLLSGTKLIISDLGNTTNNLLDSHIQLWSTQKVRQTVNLICYSLGIDYEKGEFRIYLDESDKNSLANSIIKLSQACIRVSEISGPQRFPQTTTDFNENIASFFKAKKLDYTPKSSFVGRYKNPVLIDFYVKGKDSSSLVQTLSAGSSAAAHRILTDVFAKWFDLHQEHSDKTFISIYNESADVFRGVDMVRLEEYSKLMAYPTEEKKIIETLAA